MKLIEKKCPNCGANLKFHTGDKEAKCEFCKSEFVVQNNDKEDATEFDIEKINLTKKIFKVFGIFHFIMAGIVILFILSVFIIIIVGIGSQTNNSRHKEEPVPEESSKKNEVNISIDELDENVRENLSKPVFNEAKRWEMLHQHRLQGEREVVGFYYLKNNSGNSIQVYCVIKSSYSDGNDNIALYSSYVFRGKDIDSLSYKPSIASSKYSLSTYESAYGYESAQELYNADIRENKNYYKIVATENLYID